MRKKNIIAAIREELDRRGVSPFRAAISAGLPENAIRYALEGREIRVSRLIEICESLGLEFYVGPPRPGSDQANQSSSGKSLVEDLRSRIQEYLDDAFRKAVIAERSGPSVATRQVEVRELAAAAGGGATELDERVVGFVSFQRTWLDRHGLDPTQCTVINVSGESMEPTLPEGSKILVDYGQRRRRQGRIYIVHTGDGLVVKRAKKDKKGGWTLNSDNPDWEPITWGDSEIIGEVKWVGKTL